MEIDWLFHGKVLVQMFQMRQEILLFSNKETSLTKISSNTTCLPYLVYPSRIWGKPKKLHLAVYQCHCTYWKSKIKYK